MLRCHGLCVGHCFRNEKEAGNTHTSNTVNKTDNIHVFINSYYKYRRLYQLGPTFFE